MRELLYQAQIAQVTEESKKETKKDVPVPDPVPDSPAGSMVVGGDGAVNAAESSSGDSSGDEEEEKEETQQQPLAVTPTMNWSVTQLKERCTLMGLSKDGLKLDLLNRILGHSRLLSAAHALSREQLIKLLTGLEIPHDKDAEDRQLAFKLATSGKWDGSTKAKPTKKTVPAKVTPKKNVAPVAPEGLQPVEDMQVKQLQAELMEQHGQDPKRLNAVKDELVQLVLHFRNGAVSADAGGDDQGAKRTKRAAPEVVKPSMKPPAKKAKGASPKKASNKPRCGTLNCIKDWGHLGPCSSEVPTGRGRKRNADGAAAAPVSAKRKKR